MTISSTKSLYPKATHYLGDKDCDYTLNGRKLTELRRAELAPKAAALGIDVNLGKNDMLAQFIAKAKALELPFELNEIQEKKKVKSKK